MSDNKLLDLSFEFAVAIVYLVDGVKAPKSSYMTDQLARAGTSIGANIHEAQYAQSKKDFVSKLEIALKESNEACYWLKLMYETKRINSDSYKQIEKLCGNIRRLLIASCKTLKENIQYKELIFQGVCAYDGQAFCFSYGFFAVGADGGLAHSPASVRLWWISFLTFFGAGRVLTPFTRYNRTFVFVDGVDTNFTTIRLGRYHNKEY